MIAAFGCILVPLPLVADVVLSDSHNFSQGMATRNGASADVVAQITKHSIPDYSYVIAVVGLGMIGCALYGLAKLLPAEFRKTGD